MMDIEKDGRSYASANNQTKRFLAEGAKMGFGDISDGIQPDFSDGIELVIIPQVKIKGMKEPGKLVIVPDKLVIFKNEMSTEAIEKAICQDNDPSFIHKIMMNDIKNLVFPSLEKLLGEKKFAVQIKHGGGENSTRIDMQEEGFFKIRAVFSECLKRNSANPKKHLEYEVSEALKKKYEFFEKNIELPKLYQDLVVETKQITHEEFFLNHPAYAEQLRLARINDQENPRNTNFFSAAKREKPNGDKGDELVYMKLEDKLRILEQFPELKKQFDETFQRNYYENFNDQPDKEAEFWDKFWGMQKENRTLLYGGEAKDSKGSVMHNLPVFAGMEGEETLKLDDAVDMLNLREKEDDLYEKFLFPSNEGNKQETIVDVLNNHSITVKTKA